MKKNKLTSPLKKLKKIVKTTQKKENTSLLKIPITETLVKVTDINEISTQAGEERVDQQPKKSKPREREHYVNGREFEEEIRQYYNTNFVTTKLGECINKIANGLSFAPNFINYSYKEEMVGDAIVKMFSALRNKKFKLDSGFSPFSYFTTIAFHAFINRIKKEKRHHKAITEYKEKVYNELMLDPNENNGAHIYVNPFHGDHDE